MLCFLYRVQFVQNITDRTGHKYLNFEQKDIAVNNIVLTEIFKMALLLEESREPLSKSYQRKALKNRSEKLRLKKNVLEMRRQA